MHDDLLPRDHEAMVQEIMRLVELLDSHPTMTSIKEN